MGGVTNATQAAIVAYLKQQGGSTLAETSRAVGRTTVTIRHHLTRLERAGAVEAISRRHLHGPGRPEKVYRLTPHAETLLPDNYQEMACQLVEYLLRTLPQPEAARLISGCAQQLAGELSQDWPEDLPTRRLRTSETLESRGYFPTWQNPADGRCLRLGHCPYSLAASRAPGLCVFDVTLLSALLNTQVTLERSFAHGDPCCELRFSVDRPASYRIK
jgi:predicted ArsR family transcriptional regulator